MLYLCLFIYSLLIYDTFQRKVRDPSTLLSTKSFKSHKQQLFGYSLNIQQSKPNEFLTNIYYHLNNNRKIFNSQNGDFLKSSPFIPTDGNNSVILHLSGSNRMDLTYRDKILKTIYFSNASDATSFAIDKSVESRMKIEKIDENFCFVKTKSTNFPNIIMKLIQHNYIPIISTLDITKLPLVGTNFEWSKAIFIVNSKYIKDPNYLNNAISKFYPSEIEEIKRYGKIMLAWNTRHPQIIAFNIVQFLELFSTGFNEKRLSKTIPLYPSDTNYFNKAKQNFKHYHDKYSVIILTYSRNELLLKLLQRFNEFNDVDKILVIWNNQNETSIPEKSFWANITSDVYFVKTNSNSLNNRFLPYDILRTEAILSLDDDQTLHPNQLNHAFGAWRLNKDVLVGSYPRLTQTNTSFSYHKTPIKGYYDLILTGHAFFHIKYLHIYSNQLPNEIKRWVDSNTNGEDISMNFIIAFFSNKPNIKFLEFRELSKKCSTCKHAANISSKKDHYKNRSKILNLLYNIFAINPLIQTKYILNFMS